MNLKLMFQAIWRVAFALVFCASQMAFYPVSVSAQSASGAFSLVVPKQFETQPGVAADGILTVPFREMQVYDKSQFPKEEIVISEIRFRPRQGQLPFSGDLARFVATFSTTSNAPNQLNADFASNFGPRTAVAFDGKLTVSTASKNTHSGTKEFDIRIPLTTPYSYNPQDGHLLIEFRNYSRLSSESIPDFGVAENLASSRLFSADVNGTVAQESGNGSVILELVYSPALPLPKILNINFGGGGKVGKAVTGNEVNDFWNSYNQPFVQKGWLTNLLFSDESLTSAGLIVDNAPGSFNIGNADEMFNSYMFPHNGGNITITLTNVPSGDYELYLYGHGSLDNQNGLYQVSLGSNTFGPLKTSQTPGWNTTNWSLGSQYVYFGHLKILSNQPVTITALPGASGYSVINGLQLREIDYFVVPETFDGGSTTTLFSPLRIQNCYSKALFPQKPVLIKEMLYRPAQLNGFAFDKKMNLEVRLSTTSASPEALDATFANNFGSNLVLAFSGEIHLSSQNKHSNNIADFDIKIPLTTPFLFDPSQGNLLVDIKNFTGGGSHVDGSGVLGDGAGRAYASGADSLIASGVDHGADLIKFVYVPVSNGPRTFDLSHDFTDRNPSGQWSFGWKNNLISPFSLLTSFKTSSTQNGVPIQSWSKGFSAPPSVFHNASSQTASNDNGAGVFPAGSTWFYAGVEGTTDNYCVIRFSAPKSGYFEIRSAVEPFVGPLLAGDTDFHIFAGHRVLFEKFLSATQAASFSNLVYLEMNETVDFMIGNGMDGKQSGSGLKIQATITEVTGDGSNLPEIIFSPVSDFFTNSIQVSIASGKTKGELRFTLDGSEPTRISPLYVEPFVVFAETTIKARLFESDAIESQTFSKTYRRVYAVQDGIPASWRELYFGPGFLTDPRVNGEADPDNDGQNNFREFLAGTNPTDPNSVFRVVSVHLSPVISWSTVLNKRYRVEKKNISVTNSVVTTNWFPIGGVIRATNSITSFVDITTTNTDLSIYRIQLVP